VRVTPSGRARGMAHQLRDHGLAVTSLRQPGAERVAQVVPVKVFNSCLVTRPREATVRRYICIVCMLCATDHRRCRSRLRPSSTSLSGWVGDPLSPGGSLLSRLPLRR
jgi:hypothetical protein